MNGQVQSLICLASTKFCKIFGSTDRAMKETLGRGYIGDEILPSYLGIIINPIKSVQWKAICFFFVAHLLVLFAPTDFFPDFPFKKWSFVFGTTNPAWLAPKIKGGIRVFLEAAS